jgi:bifunctional non-homologous end joining protein LigD
MASMFDRFIRKAPQGFVEPCLPTSGAKPPSGAGWVHEIKHDGYRLLVRRDGDHVRLFTRRGYDWTKKYPWIVESARKLKARSFLIDGEAVLCGADGISDFNTLHSQAYNNRVFLYGFDLLQLDDDDWRERPLEKRKAKLQRLVIESHGIRFSEHIEGDGAIVFAHACKLGLEGIVSKRHDFPYRSGRSKYWVKVRNPASAALLRYEEGTF